MPSLPPIRPEDELTAEQTAHAGAFDAPMDGPHPRLIADYAMRLGDDALILAQRLSEWCGHAPTVEVDLSLANIALDLIGQATLFLSLAGSWEGKGRTADTLAFQRDVLDFKNCLMVEQPNGDFARTMARQWLFSTFQQAEYEALTQSTEPRIAEIADKAVKEVRYHVELASDWVLRLAGGTDESRARMVEGLDWHWRFVEELFAMDAIERELAASGIGVHKGKIRPAFEANIAGVLGQAGLPLPEMPRAVVGGRKGHHSEHLGHLLAQMQFLPRTYPNASW